jgi:predicted nucleic acid-binding protein
MQILADTNVLLRLVERDHPHHAIAVEALDFVEASGHQVDIVPQIVYEFWVVATRPINVNGLGMSPQEARAVLEELLAPFRLLRDERSIYEIWQQLVVDHSVTGKHAHDARLVAAMLRHGISSLMTFNVGDFSRFAMISVLDPIHFKSIPPET